MKTCAVAVFLVAAGCAVPQNPARDPSGGVGTGGNGGDVDLGAGGSSGVGDAGVDLSLPVDDMARAAADLALGPDLLPPPDMTPACMPPAGSVCVVYPQCGCAAGQACDIPSTSGNAVCAAAGSTPDWNGCTGDGQCKKGSTCLDDVCKPFCGNLGKPSADCGGDTACEQVQDGSKNPPVDVPNYKVCTHNCDPTNPQNATGYTPCGPNVNCLPESDHYATCVGVTGTEKQDGDCTSDALACAPGYACTTDSIFSSSCYKMCHVGKSGECPSSTSCHSFGTKQYAGSVEIGYCD